VKISLLGPVEVRSDAGGAIDLGGARVRTLLIRLAVEPEQVVGHDALVDAVWRDVPPANASNALQQLVSRLRRAGIPIEGRPSGYLLRVPSKDIDLFNGETTWRGPALAEVADQHWAVAHIARATEQRLAAQEASASEVSDLEALVAANPLRERPVSLLMQALARQGRQAEALTVYERHRQLLAGELGADPSRALSELHLSLLRGEQVTKLPLALTSFVGRERDTAQLRTMLTQSRLVTLTGPGGSGKTRLAIEAARGMGSVWLVELAPLSESSEVAHAILSALGLREHLLLKQVRSADPVERIVAALSHQTGLLLLDNCEHLIAAVAGIVQHILTTCPNITVLATSREPLGMGGETIYAVEPLPPEPAQELLRDRAAASTPFTELDPVAAQRLCEALDGMPLAIELAAARLRTMPLEQLVSRLDERFRLLTGGNRTALPRHQTLRAVVDWSWDLCSPAEREVWQRFSVFHGGADLVAAEAVCGDFEQLSALVEKSLVRIDGDRYQMLETIREYGLSRLGDARKEVEREHALYFAAFAERAEPHLRAREQVEWLAKMRADHDNLHAALRRAITWPDAALALRFVAVLGWYWWLSGSRQEGSRLAAEALALPVTEAVDPQRHAIAYAVGALNIMDATGDFAAAAAWFDRAAEIGDTVADKHPLLRLVAPIKQMARWDLSQSGVVLSLYRQLYDDPDKWVAATARAFHSHYVLNLGQEREQATRDFRDALDGYREVGDRWGMSLVLEALSTLDSQNGDFASSAEAAREALELLIELGTIEDMLQIRMRLAVAQWMKGDRDGCVETLRAAQAQADELGLQMGQAMVAFGWGAMARGRADYDDAQRWFEESARLIEHAHVPPQFRAMLASTRGMLAGELGELQAARDLHTEALREALGSSDSPVVGAILVGCADLALREGDPDLAAKLLGAAEKMNGALDLSLPDRAGIEDRIIKAIGPQWFADAYQVGMAVTSESVPALTGLPVER
jgi:predicted ATPase/DNA-binding SARP family transcriptional activator